MVWIIFSFYVLDSVFFVFKFEIVKISEMESALGVEINYDYKK